VIQAAPAVVGAKLLGAGTAEHEMQLPPSRKRKTASYEVLLSSALKMALAAGFQSCFLAF